jgi:hypothetical protein
MKKIPQSGTYGKFVTHDPSLYLYPYQCAFMQQIMTGSSFQVIDGSTRSGAYWLSEGNNNRRFTTFKRESNCTVIDERSPFKLIKDSKIKMFAFDDPGRSNIDSQMLREYITADIEFARPANPILKRSYIAVKRALVEWR